ncbi:ribonuclease catalytic domain-containing protein [Solimicrobium silvestre]|uniref:RNB domain n=1 Tax=Solimicrobium silvestre TaxID=2099400 RepID=A0A2S9GUG9_9BURK|nr:ribonuclease catalytic domain-containing protein [Solimicrobium silvestre]PRC91348.1 RNB domain [Solimicrobium silvestre]
MNVFFEESGDFKAGAVMSQTPDSYQVELASGKRCKVKSRDVLIQFAAPSAEQLLREAHVIAEEIDLDFLWEVAGLEEFGYADLGKEYFGATLSPAQSAGLIFRLHSAPIYFYKKGRGHYKAAPAASVQAALAGIEKKKQQAIIQADYVEQLKAGTLPSSMQAMAQQLLYKPDKNTLEYKALAAACQELHTSPERLMLATGGIASAKDLHFSKFLFDFFPKGTGFSHLMGNVTPPELPKNLPIADVAAFSIDDISTTEIDDALSVKTLADGMLQIGIHIAAPGLGINREDAIDNIARSRMSTVYMPGDKITMLPNELVEIYTLGAGQTRPAVSLYATVNPADWSLISTVSKIEAVPISENLRNNTLDELVTEEALAANEGDYPHKADIAVLWQWAQSLEQGRNLKRAGFGLKPEQNNRTDFNFYVEDDVVSIVARKRGSPLDKIVAELMIFANSTWGKLMNDHGIPGIYRSQGVGNGGWAARMQVKMLTHAAPHHNLGVDQYAWSTSPLRRYTDLVNQWQIMACIQHGVTAPLVAPFKPRDATLFAIVSAFDAMYSGYNDFQSSMERYWCLRWFAQEWQAQRAKHVEALVMKEDLLRLVDIPLVIRLSGLPSMPRGSRVMLDIIGWDEVDLTLEARFLELLSSPDTALTIDEEETEADQEESSDEIGDEIADETATEIENDSLSTPEIPELSTDTHQPEP